MRISTKVVAASNSLAGIKIITLQLRYPRFIHAELMTHRVFSRNASSSRAIPVERLIQDILDDTAMPIHWGKNQKGMQAHEESNAPVGIPKPYATANSEVCYAPNHVDPATGWLAARDWMIRFARAYADAGYRKQLVNRLLEPFSHINVLVTSTKWKNWDTLRDHPDAQPEIRELARQIKVARESAVYHTLQFGDWHLPYIDDEDAFKLSLEDQIKVSVARCARVSYLTHEGRVPSVEEDLALYERLAVAFPPHASPAEHQATPDHKLPNGEWKCSHLHGNLHGWIQYRKTLPNEDMEKPSIRDGLVSTYPVPISFLENA